VVGGSAYIEYNCGYCNNSISIAKHDYHATINGMGIYICPVCKLPTFLLERIFQNYAEEEETRARLVAETGLSIDKWIQREAKLNSNKERTPLSIADAVSSVKNETVLQFREIEDLGELLKRIGEEAPGKRFDCQWCRIKKCHYVWQQVNNPLRIQHCIFLEEARFFKVEFNKWINFSSSTFKSDAVFSGSTFHDEAMFEWVLFEKSAHFGEGRFEQNATFYKARFRGELSFLGTEVNKRLYLSNADFRYANKRTLYFHLRPGGQVALGRDQIGCCQRYPITSKWPGRQGNLRRFIYRSILKFRKIIRQNWPSVHLITDELSKDAEKLRFAAEQYNVLRNNFRLMPAKDDEKVNRCHYKHKDIIRRSKKAYLNSIKTNILVRASRFLPVFLEWSIMKWCLGYGIYTKRILFTVVGTIVVFGLLYSGFGGPTTIKGYNSNFNSLYFSCITFTTIGYGDYAPIGWLRLLAGIEGLMGLTLMAIFTVSFARKLID